MIATAMAAVPGRSKVVAATTVVPTGSGSLSTVAAIIVELAWVVVLLGSAVVSVDERDV